MPGDKIARGALTPSGGPAPTGAPAPKPRRPVGSDPRTPLWEAARQGDPVQVRALLADGADPDNRPAYGYAPLHAAIQGQHIGIVQALLAAGANPDVLYCPRRQHFPDAPSVSSHLHPLSMAIRAGSDPRIVAELLAAGADPQKGWALHEAVARSAVAQVRALVAHPGTELDARNTNRATALQLAVRRGSHPGMQDIVALLLDAGADIEGRPRRLPSPLGRALVGGHLELARLLRARGADLQPVRAARVLHAVALRHHVDCLRFLVAEGLPVNDRNAYGRTALHEAVRGRPWAVGPSPGAAAWARSVRVLLDAGADVHAADAAGRTPWYFAAAHGDARIQDLLVRAGADLPGPPADGHAPDD